MIANQNECEYSLTVISSSPGHTQELPGEAYCHASYVLVTVYILRLQGDSSNIAPSEALPCMPRETEFDLLSFLSENNIPSQPCTDAMQAHAGSLPAPETEQGGAKWALSLVPGCWELYPNLPQGTYLPML